MPVARSADGQKRPHYRVLLSLTAFTLMSSLFSVSGFFSLKSHDPSPSRLHQSRQLPGATYHLFYESEILCGKYKSMLAVIRKDSPPSKKALPNNTMAYIVAKFHVPASLCVGPVLL